MPSVLAVQSRLTRASPRLTIGRGLTTWLEWAAPAVKREAEEDWGR
jgi:hypothetical protein